MRELLRRFILDAAAVGKPPEGFDDDTSFLDSGLLDSTGIMELVGHLEDQFGVEVEDQELVPENLDSINRLCAYLGRKGVAEA
jgi:acyl carrier protein